jgi:cytochrome c oxidase assembly factor 5
VDCETYRDGHHARALGRACAALRTRCFYEFEREDTFTTAFLSEDDDEDSSAYLRARLRWWDDRITSETLREPMMRKVGVRSLRTFAALARTDAAGRRAGFDDVSSTSEAPADAEALRRWSVAHELDSEVDMDTSGAESHVAVVGTLDVHMGPNLPGEILVGRRPFADARPAADDDIRFDPLAIVDPPRAYVFNVCVAPEFRGHGVAEAMLRVSYEYLASCTRAAVVYVHVERDNVSARRAYEKAHFSIESEETREQSARASHEPRILLYREILRASPAF